MDLRAARSCPQLSIRVSGFDNAPTSISRSQFDTALCKCRQTSLVALGMLVDEQHCHILGSYSVGSGRNWNSLSVLNFPIWRIKVSLHMAKEYSRITQELTRQIIRINNSQTLLPTRQLSPDVVPVPMPEAYESQTAQFATGVLCRSKILACIWPFPGKPRWICS